MSKKLKNTKSISPLSLRIIPAEIIEEQDGIYLRKKDEKNKVYQSLIEKDKEYYFQVSRDNFNINKNYLFFLLYISNKCNLNCKVCYEKNSQEQEISFKEIQKLAKNYKNKIFVLAGKEPTCREDLLEIIKELAQNNYVCLATNGLKLKKLNYVKKLKESGLNHILFSLDGFNEKIYTRMHGKNLLKIKKNALKNIKKAGISTIISMTIIKGLNDNEIKKTFEYCIQNNFIKELRIRSISPLGGYLNAHPICLSELTKEICKQIGVKYQDIKKEREFFNKINKFIKNKNIKHRICETYFHIIKEKKGKYASLGSIINKKGRFISKIKLAFYGFLLLYVHLINKVSKRKAYNLPNILRIGIRSWPNIYNIDLKEICNKCYSTWYPENKSFCLSNIEKKFKKIKKV